MTYPQAEIAAVLNRNFVAAKLLSADHRPLTRRYDVRWLPGLVITDADGRLHAQTVGFLTAADLEAELTYGRGMFRMAHKQYEEAIETLTEVADRWPKSPRAPEALYWVTVVGARQKKGYDPDVIRRIVAGWPDSLWRTKTEYLLEDD